MKSNTLHLSTIGLVVASLLVPFPPPCEHGGFLLSSAASAIKKGVIIRITQLGVETNWPWDKDFHICGFCLKLQDFPQAWLGSRLVLFGLRHRPFKAGHVRSSRLFRESDG